MTNKEQFEEFWQSHRLYPDWDRTVWKAWEERGKVDAKRIAELEAKLTIAIDALDMLSKLGNGDRVGNSIGNDIAVEALNKIKGYE
jgi:hypothetical protein